MRRSLGSCFRPRYLGASVVASSVMGSLATSLCAGALFIGPCAAPVYAAPTVGGDENGPQVQILQPGYQDVLKGRTKILIAVKARKFNPQSVEMFIDDKPATSGPIALGALPSAAYDWDTKLFADGPHKLTVRITDTQGFRGWAEVNIYINNDRKLDSLPPSLNWGNLAPYQQLSGKAQIQLQAIDNFGVKWIIVSVNPASEPARKPALRSWLLNRPPYIVNFDTTLLPDGLYQAQAKAWDSFEQEGNAEPLAFGIVNNAINATTVGEMLAGMRLIKEPKTQAASKPKPTPRFTVDPEEGANVSASSGYSGGQTQLKSTPPTQSTARPNPRVEAPSTLSAPKPPRAGSQLSPGQTPVAAKPSGANSQSLQPSAPALVAREVPKPRVEVVKSAAQIANPNAQIAKPRVEVAKVPTEIAKPRVEVAKTPTETAKTPAEITKPRTEIARIVETAPLPEIALPRLSNSRVANTTAPAQKLPLQAEIEGAVNDDWRNRFARAGAPSGEIRSVENPELSVENAQMTAIPREDLSVSRAGSAKIESETAPRLEAARAAIPAGAEREFQTEASQNPETEIPVLSAENGGDSTRLAQNAPLKVEAPAIGIEGRASAPETLVARAEIAPDLGAPTLSTPVLPFESRVAERVAPEIAAEKTPASRLATLPAGTERALGEQNLSEKIVSESRVAELPQISALPAAPQTQPSTRFPLNAKNGAPKANRGGKTAIPAPARVAALPKLPKSAQNGAITAISVSPLEVKTSDAIPAFHIAARATTLRAVAARYGLPVEVVAACNAWTSDKILIGGESVKLPQQLEVAYQGVPVRGDAPSLLVGGTGVTAFRFMFEQAGGKLVWDAKKQRVIARKGDSEVVLTIGSKTAKVGDQNVMMELAAFLFEGRTMVPVRFFEEGLKAQVEWDPQTGRLVVAMAG